MNFNAIKIAMPKSWLPPKFLLIMKLTTLLFFLALMKANASFSQITLKETNVPIETIFKSIKKQTGYAFFYDSKDLRFVKISVDLNNVNLETALKNVTSQLPLDYKIVGKTILLKKRMLFLFLTMLVL